MDTIKERNDKGYPFQFDPFKIMGMFTHKTMTIMLLCFKIIDNVKGRANL
jgi:hypothetical protein